MTELEKLMERIDSLETELIKNRDFLAKTHSLCFDVKTKEDVTACINSKLDLINWIREQNEEIVVDTTHDKERESNMGIWDKAVLSAGICANHLDNALTLTDKCFEPDPNLTARRTEALRLIDACDKFRDAMQAIDQKTYKYTTEEKENDGNE